MHICPPPELRGCCRLDPELFLLQIVPDLSGFPKMVPETHVHCKSVSAHSGRWNTVSRLLEWWKTVPSGIWTIEHGLDSQIQPIKRRSSCGPQMHLCLSNICCFNTDIIRIIASISAQNTRLLAFWICFLGKFLLLFSKVLTILEYDCSYGFFNILKSAVIYELQQSSR